MNKKVLYLIIACILGAITLYFAPLTGLKLPGQILLATLVFIVCVWATEAVPYPVSAIILIMLMMLANAATGTSLSKGLGAALSGFASATPLACVAATAFAVIVQRTGLSERVVYSILNLISGSKGVVKAKLLLASFFVVEIPLSFMVPSNTGRTAIYLSIAEGLQQPFKFKEQDETGRIEDGNPFQKAVYLLAGIMPAMMGGAFLTGAEATMLAGRMISETTGQEQFWALTLQYLFLPAVILIIALFFILLRMYPSNIDNVPVHFVKERLHALGPMKWSEKYVVLTLAAAILTWFTDSIHHLPAESVLFLVMIALFIPGIAPGNWKKDSKSIAWGSFLVIAVSLSFTTALSKHGVMKLIASTIAMLGITNYLTLLTVVILVLIVARIAIASHTGATVLFVPLAMELAKQSGLDTGHIVAIGWTTYVFCRAAYLLPQQSAQVIMSYDYGFFTRLDMMKTGVRLLVAAFIIYMIWGGFILPLLAQ
ncbi:MAG: SLC13 family permease [Sporomusaceae bacterium]|nr:SLC13 family permease [Sporomusaceae bacterium]